MSDTSFMTYQNLHHTFSTKKPKSIWLVVTLSCTCDEANYWLAEALFIKNHFFLLCFNVYIVNFVTSLAGSQNFVLYTCKELYGRTVRFYQLGNIFVGFQVIDIGIVIM